MQYRTGEIKHRTQGAPLAGGEPLLTGVQPVMAPVRQCLTLADLFPRLVQHLAQLRHHLRMAVLRQQGGKKRGRGVSGQWPEAGYKAHEFR